jgi:thermolysin
MKKLIILTSFGILLFAVFQSFGPHSAAQNSRLNGSDAASNAELERIAQMSLGYLNQYLAARSISVTDEFKVMKVEMDDLKMAHTRVRQTVNGIPVWEGEAIVHLRADGSLASITDEWKPAIAVNTVPVISPEEAIQISQKFYTGSAKQTATPTVDLWIYRGSDADHLTYRVQIPRIDGSKDTSIPIDFIDAHTGERVFGYDNLQSGTGSSLYSGTVNIGTTNFNGVFYLENMTRKIGTFNANNGTSPGTSFHYSDADDLWNATVQRAGVDAQYGAEATMDYYQTVHNRNGIDGLGGPGYIGAASNNSIALISSFVHWGVAYNNAMWTGQYMIYGDGDGVNFSAFVGLDTCGHEFTHGVTQYTANLTYSGESGALNESMSDVFGTMIERYKRPSTWSWRYGEDYYTPGTAGDADRYLNNPHLATGHNFTADDDPDHYAERYLGTEDNGGVHINSGISNYTFYLVSQGGTHHRSGVTVTGIGPDNAAKIWFRALTSYMGSGTNFAGARTATLSAATDLFGASSAQYTAVATAWCAVGVGPCPGGQCVPTPITVGSTVNGSLATTDCIFTGTTRYVDVYSFTGNSGQRIAISMSSAAFDTYLYLVNSGNQTVAEDDDGGGGTNSRIPLTSGYLTLPAAGTYSIYATSFSADLTGAYSLNLVNEPTCSYSLSSTALNFAAGGGNGSFQVITQTGCSWSTTGVPSWVTITSGATGSGSGFVNYAVASNATTLQRSGSITANGQVHSITQAGTTAVARKRFDFDGDGKADVAVFRGSAGDWYRINSSNGGVVSQHFGQNGDRSAAADFDGDGKTDYAIFRSSTGAWYWINSSTNTLSGVAFGQNGDLPAPADFDGDGRADICVFRPSTAAWYRINSSTNQFVAVAFGLSTDKPAVGDFDGDGKADISVFRPSVGDWYRLNSSTGQFAGLHFGANGDKAVPSDYDGDGRADIAVFRPSVGDWYGIYSGNGAGFGIHFGANGDLPSPADFDGDNRADFVVFRPSTGTWYLQRTTAGFGAQSFGANGDTPVPNSFVY